MPSQFNPTPAELAALGYKAPSSPVGTFNPTPAELAALGYKGQTAGAGTTSPGIGDTLEAGGAGFLGQASNLVGSGIHNLGTAVSGIAPGAGQEIQNFAQPTIDLGKQMASAAEQTSPTAAMIGRGAADTLGVAALPAASLPAAAASGAAIGLVNSDGKTATDVLTDTAKSAILSAGVAGAINIGSSLVSTLASKASSVPLNKAVSNIVEGSKLIAYNSETYATGALDATLKATGGDLASAKPDQIISAISKYQDSLKSQASDLYSIRDAAADAAKIMVSKSNVQDLATKLQADIATGTTEGTQQALVAANKIIGPTGADIPFAKAQTLMSDLGSSAADAASQGNGVLAKNLINVRAALGSDIDSAAKATPDIMQAHQAATDFYRESYSPIASLDMQRQVATKVTEKQFVANLVKNLGKTKSATEGFTALPDAIQQQVLGAAQQAIQDSSTTRGTIDLLKYSKSLDNSMRLNPTLYKATDSLENIKTLADVINAKAMTGMGTAKLQDSALVTAGFIGSAIHPGFLAAAAVPVVQHLYAAGKLINNEAATALLGSMRDLAAYPDSAMAKVTGDKIIKTYMNQFAGMSGKTAAVYGVTKR